jgi:hypothetical protein
MSQSHMTTWIEDAEAREIRRDVTFLTGVEEKQHIHLGTIISKVTEWWNHYSTEDIHPVHDEPNTRH